MTATATEHGAVPVARDPGRWFVVIVASCVAMAALSIDLLLPAFPEIREEFGLAADSSQPSRLLTAFFIGLAVGQLVYGPISDRFGRKPLLYAGLAIYVGGAVAAAFVSSFEALVVCRFIWGLGAAGPRSLALAMVRDTYHGEQMARIMSHVMTTFILVPIFAPAIGAGALAIAPWQVVIWMPIAAAMLLAAWMLRVPDTLPVERRRSISPGSLVEALRAVVTTRTTFAFALALTSLFGIMSSFLGSTEIIVDDVYDQGDFFPLIFGIVACALGAGSVLSGRLVTRIGLDRMLRFGASYVVLTTAALATLALSTDGHPPLWAFVIAVALMLPSIALLAPNCNTAAMAPLPHVAGMAAAIIGTVSTGAGALIGSVVDGAFDGSVRPFAVASFICALVAAAAILSSVRRVPFRADSEWIADQPAATA